VAVDEHEDGRPTLEDVAAHAGVSRSTASRALNGDTYVSARAREKVLASAAALGYSPNQAARSLVTRRTGAVAVVLSEAEATVLDDPYFAIVVRAAFRALADAGSQMLLMFVDNADDVPRTVRFLDGGHVDGALVFASHEKDPLPAAVQELRLPVVFGGPAGNLTSGVHAVDFDNRTGAAVAVEHLIAAGRKQIAMVAGPPDHRAAADRLAGWRSALTAHKMRGTRLFEQGGFTIEGGRLAMAKLLARKPDLDAVFAASDLMAAGAIRALEEAGRRIPDDVAVIGFDDNPVLAPVMKPPLSSVHQDPRLQVRQMVSTLTALLAGEDVTPARHMLGVSLTLRESG
jgi:DNA-binding LacI/PurR family transcriptional regulator